VPWRVEILDETVAAEIAALPADMQARFLRLAERIASVGLESLSEPHVKHLEGKLWELRPDTPCKHLHPGTSPQTERRSFGGLIWVAGHAASPVYGGQYGM
jgi:hypothetical protein